MNMNKEMKHLFDLWFEYCNKEDLSKNDYFIGGGKAIVIFITSLIEHMEADEELENELLENILANIERISLVILKKSREHKDG